MGSDMLNLMLGPSARGRQMSDEEELQSLVAGVEGTGSLPTASADTSRQLQVRGRWSEPAGGLGEAQRLKHERLSCPVEVSPPHGDAWGQDVSLPSAASHAVSSRDPAENREASPTRHAIVAVKSMLGGQHAFALQCWFRHFDRNHNGRIDRDEFRNGMAELGYSTEAALQLWQDLDPDKYGEITFEVIDREQSQVWSSFRRWCAAHFQDPRDMILQMKRLYAQNHNIPETVEEELSLEEFEEGLYHFGWDRGYAAMLFGACDVDQEAKINVRGLQWLQVEAKRQKAKEENRRRSFRIATNKARHEQIAHHVLADFKLFLKRSFGNTFRAWRRALDIDGTMTLQRVELFKACRQLEWKGDVRALWTALDHDGSGTTTFEELDLGSARLLAQFKEWAMLNWGSKPAAATFEALDVGKRKKISYSQFASSCESRGFMRKAKSVAGMLDWHDRKYLMADDLAFLDIWKPPEWLTAIPNKAAADTFKQFLLNRYRHMLKAWRVCLDKDNSNCVSWHEFREAARHLKCNIDIAGAWLAFDTDLSGFVSLRELCPETHDSLMHFKAWAEEEFGNVRAAFKALDKDNSGQLTFKEFRGACRNFGFQGNTPVLFSSLDIQKDNVLRIKELSFLDDWPMPLEQLPEQADGFGLETLQGATGAPDGDKEAVEKHMLEYSIPGPGPGAYTLPDCFGAEDRTPGVRHGGAFSFANRPAKKERRSVGPANYTPSLRPTTSRKPAWSFGGGGAGAPRPNTAGSTPERRCKPTTVSTSPGPGSYNLGTTFLVGGPKFSMRPRRAFKLHPAQRALGEQDRISAG